jgi:uncharacterized phage infection (PIP) family protein YhgE
MTTQHPGFWSRLTDRLKPKTIKNKNLDDLPDVGQDGLLLEPAENADDGNGDSGGEKTGRQLTRWTRRDQAINQLQQGYEKVTQLIEEIQIHLASQSDRSERLCQSLDQIARSANELPEIARQQNQVLENIAGRLENTQEHTKHLNESLGEVPKAVKIQSETLSNINRQLEMTSEQNVMSTQTIEKVGTAINALGETNRHQAEALKEMNTKADEKNEMLTQLIARQSRRFTMLFVVTLLLAAGAVTTAVMAMLMYQK